ncbi:hypothetical protein K523DRAFT_127385 [Schizophyllum commune Tattone D]|nr:hypothetical protein K523DRAFT_127385 [Schizophyllum commune Tattone D]
MPMVLRLLQYREPAPGSPALQDKDIVAEVLGHTGHRHHGDYLVLLLLGARAATRHCREATRGAGHRHARLDGRKYQISRSCNRCPT